MRGALGGDSAPTRWYPGYRVAMVSAVGLIATAPGQTFIISQLNVPLATSFAIQPLVLNTAYTLATVLAALPLVHVGAWTDRMGARRALIWIAAAFSVACCAMATVQGIVGVFLGFLALRLLGQGALSLASQYALAMWFHRRLGFVQGWLQVVLFTAWAPLPLLAVWGIETIGWRWTYVIFGGTIATTLIPLAHRFVRDRPEQLGLEMDGDPPRTSEPRAAAGPVAPPPLSPDWALGAALRTRSYWTLAGYFFVSPLIGTALLFDLQPMLVARDLPASSAALPVSVWSVTMALAAVPSGTLADRIRPRVQLPLAAFLIGSGALVMTFAAGVPGAITALVFCAVGQSLGTACGSATVARYFGRLHHGAIRASLARIGVIGAGLGPLVTGLSASFRGAYEPALIGFVMLCLPLVVAACWLVPPIPDEVGRVTSGPR